jgi:L-2,4-diaminobutyrate decarboxylase
MIVSDRLRHRMTGIERADSIAWDAHKTMFVPAACTMLFYRERNHAHAAFRQEASYVFERTPDRYTEFDAAEKNFECTKRPMIMTLWVPWALYGPAPFVEKIEGLCDMAVEVHAMLSAQRDFEPLHRPDSNILCFRYVPARRMDAVTLGALQVEIRNRVRARGHFFISKVDLDGQPVLRLVFMNHLVTTEHVGLLLEEIRTVAEMILEEQA